MTILKNSKYFVFLPILMVLSATAVAAESSNLDQGFQDPPGQTQPWVYWVWLDTDIPQAAITRDLQEMKAKGIAGCILYGCPDRSRC